MEITITSLQKSYGNRIALDGITFSVGNGMFGLIGRNGAGKTTLMRILATLSRPSGGMKRRLGIAQALLNDPQVLIVDEPTAGLDPEERLRFYALLGEFSDSRTVMVSFHIMSDIEAVCENVAVLDAGRLLFAGAAQGIP